jgi:hypothetical protein
MGRDLMKTNSRHGSLDLGLIRDPVKAVSGRRIGRRIWIGRIPYCVVNQDVREELEGGLKEGKK